MVVPGHCPANQVLALSLVHGPLRVGGLDLEAAPLVDDTVLLKQPQGALLRGEVHEGPLAVAVDEPHESPLREEVAYLLLVVPGPDTAHEDLVGVPLAQEVGFVLGILGILAARCGKARAHRPRGAWEGYAVDHSAVRVCSELVADECEGRLALFLRHHQAATLDLAISRELATDLGLGNIRWEAADEDLQVLAHRMLLVAAPRHGCRTGC